MNEPSARDVELARGIELHDECVCQPSLVRPRCLIVCPKHREIAQALADRYAAGRDEERERRQFTARDHPNAGGRKHSPGETEWRFTIPLDDGTTLTLRVGRVGRDALIAMAHEEATDDALDAAAIRAAGAPAEGKR